MNYHNHSIMLNGYTAMFLAFFLAFLYIVKECLCYISCMHIYVPVSMHGLLGSVFSSPGQSPGRAIVLSPVSTVAALAKC